MSTQKVMAGILAGLAVGALFGVLTASEKGEVTRKNILKMGDDYSSDLKAKFNEFIDNLSDSFVSAKDEGRDLLQNGVSEYMHAKNQAQQIMKDKFRA